LRNQGPRFDPACPGTTKEPQAITAALGYPYLTAFTPACRRILAHQSQRRGFIAIRKEYLGLSLSWRIGRKGSDGIQNGPCRRHRGIATHTGPTTAASHRQHGKRHDDQPAQLASRKGTPKHAMIPQYPIRK
jgi:hypothetical protein